LIISHPFISLRTGDPTVYLIRPLNKGGCIVGELNLGMFQQDITNIMNRSDKDFVFIMDQAGTLLAHPSSDLVKQQANFSNLKIFRSQESEIYRYNGTRVLGSIVRAERTGWVVVDQAPLSLLLHSFAWSLGVILSALIVIWVALVWHLRRQIQKYVFNPLEQLSRETNALTIGDFSKATSLSSMPAAFAELNKLAADFQYMRDNLQIRENALRESKEAIQKANDELE
ncbi:MAG: cache domain-containing protein, partial [Bacillota bacterium]